jgi:hypothetical protein
MVLGDLPFFGQVEPFWFIPLDVAAVELYKHIMLNNLSSLLPIIGESI